MKTKKETLKPFRQDSGFNEVGHSKAVEGVESTSSPIYPGQPPAELPGRECGSPQVGLPYPISHEKKGVSIGPTFIDGKIKNPITVFRVAVVSHDINEDPDENREVLVSAHIMHGPSDKGIHETTNDVVAVLEKALAGIEARRHPCGLVRYGDVRP